MKFIEAHPNYRNYTSDKYYIDEIPREFIEVFKGYIIGNIENTGEFKHICSIIAKHIPSEPPSNWGFPWLHGDLDDLLYKLNRKKYQKFMDCVSEIVFSYFRNELEEINELLEESEVGYKLDFLPYEGAIWELRGDVDSTVETLDEALDEVPFTYENTKEHLQQAKDQLSRMDNSRARKDALRDCVSGLESYLKYITGENNLRNSVNHLVTNDIGTKKILRDGVTIWTYVHEELPDIRHGHDESTVLTKEEVLYWIERIMSLIKYLSRIGYQVEEE
ncbi:MAG: hypothetical protein E6778_17775 [Niallia nealsonii]|nr:hypothetical protein [Niallia nealsonii]